MSKYRSLWYMSTTNHNILYFNDIQSIYILIPRICLWKAGDSLARRRLGAPILTRFLSNLRSGAVSRLLLKPIPRRGTVTRRKTGAVSLRTCASCGHCVRNRPRLPPFPEPKIPSHRFNGGGLQAVSASPAEPPLPAPPRLDYQQAPAEKVNAMAVVCPVGGSRGIHAPETMPEAVGLQPRAVYPAKGCPGPKANSSAALFRTSMPLLLLKTIARLRIASQTPGAAKFRCVGPAASPTPRGSSRPILISFCQPREKP